MRKLRPTIDLQSRNRGVLRQRRRIEDPCVGDVFLQLEKMAFTEFPAPEFAQWPHPEKSEPELLLEIGFDRRSDVNLAIGGGTEELLDAGKIRQVKQFKKAIDAT